jgi:hypothetical protein
VDVARRQKEGSQFPSHYQLTLFPAISAFSHHIKKFPERKKKKENQGERQHLTSKEKETIPNKEAFPKFNALVLIPLTRRVS